MICPAPLAAALEMEKGEQLGRVIKDRNTLDPSGGAPVQGQRRPLMSSDFGVLPGMESGAAAPVLTGRVQCGFLPAFDDSNYTH